ncbi:putative NADP(+)-dependent dehydrogenase [Karstenula rhodostoma CBS 690.94]|uniref:NADP(+)-dependent dehydrogenase n=1 Tax=Karstenula rhodostoma CBS 690.94 TaxID=1392251 RepID=A0A9P4P8I2_9PLEO|nr:putative NADP(+)-dependent dehydrogenase [Karstenula rhodostoma CBS 690.94]
MSFLYKHVLLIGATSGIGKTMADKLIAEGIHVTAVGRRKDRLDAFVSNHGFSKASSLVADISDLDSLPAFVENAITQHPTIDAVFLNAGQQRRFNFASPSTVQLSQFNTEMTTNFTSFVALTHAFLPHLLASSSRTALIYTGTHISLVPGAPWPAYSASKAALDAFIQCIREQLRNTTVNILHISPPLVQSEIHDFEMGAEVGQKMGISVEEFVAETWAQLKEGKKDVYIGSVGASSKEQFMEIADKRAEAIDRLNELIRKLP